MSFQQITCNSVSIVIVSFNTAPQLRRCLAALPAESEVIVVDNASTDGSAEMVKSEFPGVRVIENEENLGFGSANNYGMRLSTRPLTLFLNSDAYAEPGAIASLTALFADQSVSAGGGRLLNPDGTLQRSSARDLTLWRVFLEQTYLERIFGGYWTTDPDWTDPIEVDQVMGACLMIRTASAEFDERFFLYCEDTELCSRLKRLGRILYVPDAVFIHELGTSSKREPWIGIARYNAGKELYFAITSGPSARVLCFILNRLGAMLRLIAYCVLTMATLGTGRYRELAKTWLRVLTAPLPGPPRPGRTGR